MSYASGTMSPQPSISTSMHARSSASMQVAAHTPFSNLPEDSVRMPRLLAVTRLLPLSKAAHSNSTLAVSETISLSSPPMMPARPVAFSSSAMTSMSGVSWCSLPSRVFSISPSFAFLTTMVCPCTLLRSNACMGWPVSSITKLVMSTMLLIERTPAP